MTDETKKSSQAAAQYQFWPLNGQYCQICALFQNPNKCKVVAGNISPGGWCRNFIGSQR